MDSAAQQIVIPNGGQYAKRGRPAKNWIGTLVLTFVVKRRLPTLSQNPYYELECRLCGVMREAFGSAIVGALNGRFSMRPCGCVTGRFLTPSRCRDALGLGVAHVEVMLLAMALHRVSGGMSTSRLELEAKLGREPNTLFLVRTGYLERRGKRARLRPTAKSWSEFGFSPDGWPGDAIDPTQIDPGARYR